MNTRFLLSLGGLVAGLMVFTPTRLNAAEPPVEIPIPAATSVLKGLRPEHPRLLATAADFERLRVRVAEDATLRDWRRQLQERAARLLNEPPSQYEIPDGLRLLAVSRQVLGRVYTLALLNRLEGDPRYAERAWKELEAAARFPDWNPRHFLDTAEMTHAFAIGYDWLYDRWTEDQRALLRRAIVDKGLGLAVACYRGTKSYGGWMKVRHNWNQVCNGGIGLGALALADVEPALAGEFLSAALRSLQLPMREFAPDGAWSEGPGYWNYATSYNVALLAALPTALGTDFGLPEIPGFAEAGTFPLYLTGPLGRTFNYADGGDSPVRAPQMFWLARRFGRPAYARYQRPLAAPHALDLLWYDPTLSEATPAERPLDRYFQRAEVVTMRGRWDDRDALFVGFKAGDNRANHSHLDLGTFVLDALGVRWGLDLGADDYNLPGYFGKPRWTYYRLRAEGHNTLVINPGAGPDQEPAAAARIGDFVSTPASASATADLTAAYAPHAQRVERQLSLPERRSVRVRDRVRAAQPVEVWRFFHTRADVTVADDGRAARLRQEGQELRVCVLEPPTARLTVMAAQPLPSSPTPEKQHANPGVRKLAIQLKQVSDLTLEVAFEPGPAGEEGGGRK